MPWLFKSEPDAFSIDDLKKAGKKGERWDGIRNYQARNFLRDDVRKGDDVLVYHSNCKVPAVVGTARVVREAYPDPTQFDPEAKYYDPRSPLDNPRWVAVDITHVSTLRHPVSLQAIKANPALADMVLVSRGRLSIQPVTEQQWAEVLRMAGNA